MKKLLLLSIVILAVLACKKTEFSPAGPTDVRIKNISDQILTEVKVNIKGNIQNYGDIAPQQISDYARFDTAYVKAEITAKVNNETFSTGSVNYMGLTYIGRDRITYVVWIKDFNNKKLEINNVIIEEPLILE